MCGIAGYIGQQGIAARETILSRMAAEIRHRGPDNLGVLAWENVGLAHTRLSIIDLSPMGHQPMTTPDGRFTITFNGEIYNFRELRRELQGAGVSFQGHSDTEVLLHWLATHGMAGLPQVNGMFAFAFLDRHLNLLHLARDRYGIKPLYHSSTASNFMFGSEIKAILAHPAASSALDPKGLLEYFTFQNFFTDATLNQGVKLLPAGHHMTLDVRTREVVALVQFWDFNFREPEISQAGSFEENSEELHRLFVQAVQRQLVSDVEVGSYLSGGMDSGAITAVAAKNHPYLKTFTCGFDLHSASGLEMSYDERELAEYMSYLFKTEHYEIVLKSGDMERCLPKLAWHIEEPRVGQSYPNYYVASLSSKFVKTVLSGTGGDELFGGYPWRYFRAVNCTNFDDYVDKYYLFWQRLIPNSLIREVFSPIWGQVKDVWTRDIFRDVFRKDASLPRTPEDYVNLSLHLEAKTFLHGLLVIEDKISMAHSLETRVPFLDNDLVDFAMRVPVSHKVGNLSEVVRLNENEPGHKTENYFRKTKDGKLIFRDAMGRILPQQITSATKQGFSAPDASWFKGDSIDFVMKTIQSDHARIYEFMDRKTIRSLVDEHVSGKTNRRLLIWSLLNFEHWCQHYL